MWKSGAEEAIKFLYHKEMSFECSGRNIGKDEFLRAMGRRRM